MRKNDLICILQAVAFHPNGAYLASGSADKTVTLWSLAEGRPVRVYQGIRGTTQAIAFSPDGKYMATGGIAES